MTVDTAAIGELLDYLTPAERVELDTALAAAVRRPLPDVEYQRDPIGWARDVLGIPEATVRWSLHPEYATHQWDGTPDPLAAIAEALADGRDVGVESATGTGKTYNNGWFVLWFVACFPQALVVTTAAKEDQLTLQLWKEMGRHWPRFKAAYPDTESVQLRVRMAPGAQDKDGWAVIGYACGVEADTESARKAQGFHAAHMLLVGEEAPGIPQAVHNAFANTATGTHNLRLNVGNPDNQHDPLHQFCMEAGVVHVRISALDHPNVVTGRDVIPGAATRKSVEALRAKWGEGSAMYGSRVRGISPPQAADALIRKEWLELAAARFNDPAFRIGKRAKGVDVAQSEAGDKAAVADWSGACLLGVRAFHCPNATQLGRDVWMEVGRDRVEPYHVGVDPVGVGAATANALDELSALTGRYVQKLNGGAAPVPGIAKAPDGSSMDWAPEANSFANLRSQMWWQLREDFRRGHIAIPPEEEAPELWRQLTLPTFAVKTGKTWVEGKKEIRKRTGGKSPDDADAVVYGNWVRQRVPLPEETHRSTRDIENRHPGYARAGNGLQVSRSTPAPSEADDGPLYRYRPYYDDEE